MSTRTDICARKHSGNPESAAANRSGDRSAQCERVWKLIYAHGSYGATAHEIAAELRTEVNCISGRFSQLKAAGLIVRVLDGLGNPVRRETVSGCFAGVYKVVGAQRVEQLSLL